MIAKYKATNDLAFIGELYKKYAKQILSVCIFYFRDKDEAKDHVMQIFDKLIHELKQKEVDNFKGWLSFVVRNYCISVLRKQKTDQNRLKSYYEYEKQVLDEETELAIEAIPDTEITTEQIKDCLSRLKKGQQECVQLFYLQSRSYSEITAATGYSLNEVKSYIQNGKRNLKIMLEELKKAPKVTRQ